LGIAVGSGWDTSALHRLHDYSTAAVDTTAFAMTKSSGYGRRLSKLGVKVLTRFVAQKASQYTAVSYISHELPLYLLIRINSHL
jgi:hypothetical protein